MKKVNLQKLVAVSLVVVILPLSPAYSGLPTADFPDGLAKTADAIVKKVDGVTTKIQTQISTVTNQIKGAVSSVQDAVSQVTDAVDDVKGKIDEAMNFEININIPAGNEKASELAGAREIAECKIADITKEDSVQEAFTTLFLQYPEEFLEKYPENPNMVKKAYKEKGLEFSNDMLLEMYISVRELEERMASLKEEFDELSSCYVQGQSGSGACSEAEANDEELGIWKNLYQVNKIYDSMLKITEELVAMKAQYAVAQALLGGIEPAMPEKESEKVSSNDTFIFSRTEKAAFAQLGLDDTLLKTSSVQSSSNSQPKGNVIATDNSSARQSFGGSANVSATSGSGISVSVEPMKEVSLGTGTATSNGGLRNNIVSGNDNNVSVKAQPASGSTLSVAKSPVSQTPQAVAAQPDKPVSRLAITTPAKHTVKSPFTGADAQFADLEKTNGIYLQLATAQKVHNVKKQLPDFRKVFFEVQKIKQLHAKAVDSLKQAENCVVSYLGNYYNNPTEFWLGNGCAYDGNDIICDDGRTLDTGIDSIKVGDMLCEYDRTKICNKHGINSYGSRGGFAGWLISAYKLLKAEKTFNLEMEDYSTDMQDPEGSSDIEDIEDNKEKFKSQSGSGDSTYLKPSIQPQIEAATREQELMSWQTGAEGAKKIAEYMRAGEAQPYSMWNDEKYFYDQYLEEKYRNMKLYIRDLDLRRYAIKLALKITDNITSEFSDGSEEDDDLVEVSASSARSYNQNVLNEALRLFDADTSRTTAEKDIEKIHRGSLATLTGLQAGYNRSIDSINTRKTATYKVLDEANLLLNEQKGVYNQAVQDQKQAVGSADAQDDILGIAQARREKSPNVKDNFVATAEQEKAANKQLEIEAGAEMASVGSQIEAQREQIDGYNDMLDQANEDIQTAKKTYVTEAANYETTVFNAMDEAMRKLESTGESFPLDGSSYITSAKASFSGNYIKKEILQNVVGLADTLMENAREQVIADIEAGYNEIVAKGEDKYTDHDGVLDIHGEIIEDMGTPNIASFNVSLYGGTIVGAQAAVNAIFGEIVKEIVCPNDSCYTADSQYFVGLAPRVADFQAPKGITTSYTPPLREIMHFDTTDYDNVIKTDDLLMSRHEFLTFGQDIPQIWKTILQPKGFVEKDVDVRKILAHNEEADAVLMRGGMFPCIVADKYELDVDEDGTVYVYSKGHVHPQCHNIKSVNVRATGAVDITFNDGSKTAQVSANRSNRQISELALLLSYSDKGLTFSDKVKEIMEFYENYNGDDDNTSKNDEKKHKKYDKVLLKRNQFGKFLDFIEVEEEYQKAVDELEVKADDARQKLLEIFESVGFEADPKFDLADEDTYEDMLAGLDTAKNELVGRVVLDIKGIKTDNVLIEEKMDKLNAMLGALQLDNEELILLSDNMTDTRELAEQIKREKVDRESTGKYQDEADEEFENNLSGFEEPYCPVYN